MPDLSAFPITKRWPAQHPDRLQLYSLPTPNGVKVSIMLEEIGLAVRAASRRLRQGRPEDAGIPVAQSERQDPGDPRSRRAGRQAVAAVRVGRDPALSRREDRQAAAGRRRRGAGRRSSGCISRWAASGRCSARSASSTSSPARISRTSGRCSAMSARRSACSACWRRASQGRQWIMDDDYTIADISMLGWVRNLDRLLRRARSRRVRRASSTSRPGWSADWRAPRCSAGSIFRSGLRWLLRLMPQLQIRTTQGGREDGYLGCRADVPSHDGRHLNRRERIMPTDMVRHAVHHRQPWYKILYIQVLIAIVLGIMVGCEPDLGKELKPLGDALHRADQDGDRAGDLLHRGARHRPHGRPEARRPRRR